MSIIIDFYKGNGGGDKDKKIFIRKISESTMFRFFRLTIIFCKGDIVETTLGYRNWIIRRLEKDKPRRIRRRKR